MTAVDMIVKKAWVRESGKKCTSYLQLTNDKLTSVSQVQAVLEKSTSKRQSAQNAKNLGPMNQWIESGGEWSINDPL